MDTAKPTDRRALRRFRYSVIIADTKLIQTPFAVAANGVFDVESGRIDYREVQKSPRRPRRRFQDLP